MMFGCRIVEFLHKGTHQIFAFLAFGELASGGFFHWMVVYQMFVFRVDWKSKMAPCQDKFSIGTYVTNILI